MEWYNYTKFYANLCGSKNCRFMPKQYRIDVAMSMRVTQPVLTANEL